MDNEGMTELIQFTKVQLDQVQEVEGEDKTLNYIMEQDQGQTIIEKLEPSQHNESLSLHFEGNKMTEPTHGKQNIDSYSSTSEHNELSLHSMSIREQMQGERYFALLSGDRLMLFQNEQKSELY